MKFKLITIGLVTGVCMTAVMTWTFYTAYFHPTKQVLIDINHFGEAGWEAFVVPFALILTIASLILHILTGRGNRDKSTTE